MVDRRKTYARLTFRSNDTTPKGSTFHKYGKAYFPRYYTKENVT